MALELTNYDTLAKNYDTTPLRLYKVDRTFYYRRRIKHKLFRISLKTKNIKTALKRRKILDLIDGEEMYKIETADFKMMFEYDTAEELQIAIESVQKMQMQAQLNRYEEVKEHIKSAEDNENELTFELLRDKFVYRKKADEKVSPDSIAAYNTTFKMLIKYFKDIYINDISVEDFEEWKDALLKEGGRMNRTINKHMTYTKDFIKFAVDRHLLVHNNAKPLSLLDETQDKQDRKQEVENYSLSDVEKILNYTYKSPVYNKIYKIALYSALRQNEINSLTQDNIVQDKETGIYYFNITKSKSVAGVRKVPIHKDILEMVLATSFPLMPNMSKNAFSKTVRYHLYKVIEEGQGQNFHTFRATFIERSVKANIDKVNSIFMLQEIVGHAKGETALTLDTYAKGFDIDLLQDIVDKVDY